MVVSHAMACDARGGVRGERQKKERGDFLLRAQRYTSILFRCESTYRIHQRCIISVSIDFVPTELAFVLDKESTMTLSG